MKREALLTSTLVEIADTLVDDFDVVDLLSLVADRCVAIFDASAAGIMLAGTHGNLRPLTSSSEAMRLLELFEVQAQEGPCLDCHATGRPVSAADLGGDTPWPRFSERAVAAGFRSVHALPMRRRGAVLGALNLFRTETGSMDDADLSAAQALADIATVALMQQRLALDAQLLNEQLQSALNSRIAIEQAKGMIAQQFGLDMEAAFQRLRTYARNNRLGLSKVASDLAGGVLPVATV